MWVVATNLWQFPFCIFVILRFFYLLIFASDERRELVFGDKDYNPF